MQISGHAPNTKVNHFIQHHHAILRNKKFSLFLVMYHRRRLQAPLHKDLKDWGVNDVGIKKLYFFEAGYDYYNLKSLNSFNVLSNSLLLYIWSSSIPIKELINEHART